MGSGGLGDWGLVTCFAVGGHFDPFVIFSVLFDLDCLCVSFNSYSAQLITYAHSTPRITAAVSAISERTSASSQLQSSIGARPSLHSIVWPFCVV